MSRRTTIVTSLIAGAVALGSAATAHAVDLRGGSIQMVLQKQEADGDYIDMSQQEIDEFFNQSNCWCETQFGVELTLQGASGTLNSESVEVWVGANCDNTTDVAMRDQQCVFVDSIPDINSLKTPTVIPINAGDLMWPNSPTCQQQEVTRNIYLLVDDNGDLQYENVITLADEIVVDTAPPPAPEPAEVTRGEQGALVTWTTPTENGDDVLAYQVLCARADGSWSADDGFPRDDAEYLTPLMVCPERFTSAADPGAGTGTPPVTPAAIDGGIPDAGTPDASPVDLPDGGPPPTGIDILDPDYVCSGSIGKTESSFRVDGLADGVEYRIFLVTIDPRLNPTVLDLGTVTPSSVTDFWEDYKDRGGSADGGYCFVATATFGDYDHPFVRVLRDFRDEVLATSAFGRGLIRFYYDHSPGLASVIAGNPLLRAISWLLLLPLVLFAGIWVYTGLLGKLALVGAFLLLRRLRRIRAHRRAALVVEPARDRRRARALAAATTAAALLAWSHIASAQPYWDEPGGPAEAEAKKQAEEQQSAWMFELKLGPYVPDIDSEFSLAAGEQGPYERMFGNDKQVMTILELDRFLLYPYGQLGIGIGIGYLTTTARAYEIDSMGNVLIDPDTGRPIRSAGDETTLRILPMHLNAVYRLTKLDDEVGVPIIPYGKVGLAWYVWQITRPDGSTAFVNDDPMCTSEDCSTNDGRGGTLGWQATVGLSIRAERLDPKAARGLQGELGIDHAGFFAELSYAKIDGLTSSDRLHLGDFTWYAGINFEF